MEDDIEEWKQIITPTFIEYPFGDRGESRDLLGLLHSDEGPALVSQSEACWYKRGRRHGLRMFSDGRLEYYFAGVRIPEGVNPWLLDRSTMYRIMEGFYEVPKDKECS